MKNRTVWHFSQHRFSICYSHSNSLLSCIFLSIIFLLRTLFSRLSHVPYEHFVLLFFSNKNNLIQKLWYCFNLVKFNLIFHFWLLMKALTLYVPGKMQQPPNFLKPYFDLIIKLFLISILMPQKYSIFLIIQGCTDLMI